MNYNINLMEMKKKTEIENNLLDKINSDLKECNDDLQYIEKNYKLTLTMNMTMILINSNKLVLLDQIIIDKNIIPETKTKLIDKLFIHINQTYWIFQYFFLKKKDFMGMNLTGLVKGKMETGLGFRNSLEKIQFNLIKSKYPELIPIFKPNLMVHLVKSNSFKWDDFGLDMYKNFIVISDLETKEYFIVLEKN